MKVVAWEIAHLGSLHLGKYPWKVAALDLFRKDKTFPDISNQIKY